MSRRSAWIGRGLGAALVEHLMQPRPAAPPVPSPPVLGVWVLQEPAAAPALSVEERLAAFMDRFCYVRSDYARQWARVDPDTGERSFGWARVGKQQPDDCTLTPQVVEAHLRGQLTIGTYLLDAEDRCRLVVLDHDDKRTLPELDPATGKPRVIEEDGLVLLQDCRERLRQQGIACAVSESRRGGHLFIFLAEPVPARDARALAFLALGPDEAERMALGHQAFEIYPKQDRASGVGSNIALPLGVHLKDGQRHPFVDAYGETVAPTLWGQVEYIASLARCPAREVLRLRPWLYEELDRAMHPARPRDLVRQPEPARPWAAPDRDRAWPGRTDGRSSMIARWKAGVDCRDVVQAYGVELSAAGSGRCPFHDDEHASFQAWADGWTCYAENRGGDALQFVMEQEGMDAREALAYVRGRFPVPGLGLEHGQRLPQGRA